MTSRTPADFTGDGIADLVTSGPGTQFALLRGNGNGTFRARTLFDREETSNMLAADINFDGHLDLIAGGTGPRAYITLGNGDGTFRRATSFALSTVQMTDLALVDINEDGKMDLAADWGSGLFTALGNGNGTFRAPIDGPDHSGGTAKIALADFNNDSSLDFAATYDSGNELGIFLGEREESSLMPMLYLLTQQGARDSMAVIDETLGRILGELGALGSVQSRLSVAAANLQTSRESYISAYSRIADADVAEEAAAVVRARILQRAGVAVLSQSNLAPELALRLLQS